MTELSSSPTPGVSPGGEVEPRAGDSPESGRFQVPPAGTIEVALPAFGPDVILTLRRLAPSRVDAALVRAMKAGARLDRGDRAQVLAEYGLPETISDLHHISQTVLAVEIAVEVVVGWRGVVLQNGRPAPVNRCNLVAVLADHQSALAFCSQIKAHAKRLRGPSAAGRRPVLTRAPTKAWSRRRSASSHRSPSC